MENPFGISPIFTSPLRGDDKDQNHNGRIEGDNGDGKYENTESWTELNPNSWDTDRDSLRDGFEKLHGYDPLSNDTDSDGLNDTEEDKNKDGDLDPGESDPKKMDTDGDGLIDSQERNGWTIVIIKEATGEQDNRYDVTSDPMDPDSDDDNINDYSEFQNVTDPNKSDTDGDGMNDYTEIMIYTDSSPWGIDGISPNITSIDKKYQEKYSGYAGLQIIGVSVEIIVAIKDDFGINWINVNLQGEGNQKIYCENQKSVKKTFKFDSENYARILWSGFKINITAADKNNNIGYKESDIKGIIKAKFDALIGILLPFAKLLMELIAKLCDWLYDLPKKLLYLFSSDKVPA